MENFTNNGYQVITDKRSIPFNQALTGTIQTKGVSLTGVGTSFISQLPAGSYIVNLGAWELRRVVRIQSDTSAVLDKPFSVDLPALTVGQCIPGDKASPFEISVEVEQENPAALLWNQTFKGILTYSKASRDRSAARDIVHPIIVDASGTQMKVSFLY